MSKEDYVIVEFPEEYQNGEIPMAVISSRWMFEKEGNLLCYWPVYLKSTAQREKSIQKHLEVKQEKCTICPVRVKYSSNNYEDVQTKLRSLEEEGSSQSEVSISFDRFELKKQRTATKSQQSDFDYSFCSDDEEEIPNAPKLHVNESFKKVSNKVFTDLITVHPQTQSEIKNISKNHQTIKETEKSQSFANIIPARPQIQAELKQINNGYQRLKDTEKSRSFTDVIFAQSGIQAELEEINETVREKTTECCCNKNIKLLSHLVKEMVTIRKDVRHLILISEKTDVPLVHFSIQKCDVYDDLVKFNANLKDEEFFKKCCMTLGLVGGKDYSDTTRRVLSSIIGHKLSLEINFTGKNKKQGLQLLDNVLLLIKAAVRKNPLSGNCTDTEINQVIMVWLRNAPDREGGRTRRQKITE